MSNGKTNKKTSSTQTKKVVLVAVLVGLMGLLVMVNNSSKSRNYTSPAQKLSPSATIPDAPLVQPLEKDVEQIIRLLLEDHFSSFERSSSKQDEKLDDFSIEDIEGVEVKDGIFIEFHYSVKPSYEGSTWSQGNGMVTSDGWIKGNYGCTTVEVIDGSYKKIEGFGSACGIPQ